MPIMSESTDSITQHMLATLRSKQQPLLSGLEIRAVRLSAGRSCLSTQRRMQARLMIRKSQKDRSPT